MPAIDSSIEREFARLVAKWKDETRAFSTTYDKVVNDSFLQIMALGKAVVPLILEDLKHQGGHWHTALQVLAGENPVPEGFDGNSVKVREIWLEWGAGRGLM